MDGTLNQTDNTIERHAPSAGAKAPDSAALSAMLEAREARWARRLQLAEKAPSLISLTLCVPLPFRADPEAKSLLFRAAEKLREALRDEGFAPQPAEISDGADGAAVFLPCRGDAEAVKRFCVHFEEELPAGRLLDVDVMKQGGAAIGRAELGLSPRRCFICGRPAAECVAGVRHGPEEIAAFVREKLREEREE